MGPDGYSSKCDVWSMGITAIELAEMAPPMFDLHPMRALYLIPKNPPPKLSDKGKWGKDFYEWVKTALNKNPSKRPSAGMLMKHPFFKVRPRVGSVTLTALGRAGRTLASASPLGLTPLSGQSANSRQVLRSTPNTLAELVARVRDRGERKHETGVQQCVAWAGARPAGPVP